MKPLDRALAMLLAAAVVIGIAWASHLPMPAHASPDAVLRLAWSARPERIEECRAPGAEELASRPKHMRQQLICEGAAARYRLEVRYDGRLVADEEVRGGGLRHDRRLYVLHELPVPPGEARVDVRFTRIDSPASKSASRQRGEVVPARLALDEQVTFRPREVVLVTYDADDRELEIEEDQR
jgi:hypothetical protein